MQITIVSRSSNLALCQSDIVKNELIKLIPQAKISIHPISTRGDQILNQSLTKIGGKGLFVKELQQYLLDKKADIAVHSMKDVPVKLPDKLCIAAILPRADHRDVLVGADSVSSIPPGTKIGTSSLRRKLQILAVNPHIQTVDLRGNVETRLKKLNSKEFGAIILANAGLQRLGYKFEGCILETKEMLPAVGQGALGIEICQSHPLRSEIEKLNDLKTAACVLAERTMSGQLGGDCTAPVAGYAQFDDQQLILQGLVGTPDGCTILFAEAKGTISDATKIGYEVAAQLINQGAKEIINALKQT